MINKIKTFARLRPQLKIMILQTFVFSLYTGFLFAFFNRYARFGERLALTENSAKNTVSSSIAADEKKHTKINDIAKAIHIVSKYIPWKNVCRHQAYQAKLLCNLYNIPYLIFIGFKKDIAKNEIQAHAWTMAGGRMITGFCNPEEYIIQSIYKNR